MRNGRLIFSLHRTSNCFRPSMSSLFLSLSLSLSVALSTAGVLPLASCFSTHSPAGKLFFSLCSLAPLFASSLSSLSLSLSLFLSFSCFVLLFPLSCSSLSYPFSPLPLLFILFLLLFLRCCARERSGRRPCFSRPETPTHRGSVRDSDAQRWERTPRETFLLRPVNRGKVVSVQR